MLIPSLLLSVAMVTCFPCCHAFVDLFLAMTGCSAFSIALMD